MNSLPQPQLVKNARKYLPAELSIVWEEIAPIFNELINRSLNSTIDLEQWLRDRSELEAALEEDFGWRYIKMTCDTTNKELLESFQYFAEEIEPKTAPLTNKLDKKLLSSPFKNALNKDKYAVYLRGIESQEKLFREANIPLLSQIQIKQQNYAAIAGAMSVILKGKEYTLEQAATFLKDTNRSIRKEAYDAITQRRLQDKDKLDELFSELLAMRHQVALNAGFTNYRDYMFEALGRFDYTPEDCTNFHEAIAMHIVPLLKKRAEERRLALGLDVLKPWDMDVDSTGLSALQPFNNTDELIEKSIHTFGKLHPYLASCLKVMNENNLFDLSSRKGKAPGGYNYPLAESGAPFIFMNSANSVRDLTTMVHEGGHAVHTFLSAKLELNAFKHTPSEVAELASMSMELLSMEHWDTFFTSKQDLKRAKVEHIADILKVFPWIAVVDKFQHWIYTNPKHTTAERTLAWKNIFTEFGAAYTNWDGYEAVRDNLWQKQLHIFEVPFYYIEYGIAQLGALGVWKNFKENPDKAIEQYIAALQLGYTRSMKEIYQTAGIRFDFSAESVKDIARFLEDQLEVLKEDL